MTSVQELVLAVEVLAASTGLGVVTTMLRARWVGVGWGGWARAHGGQLTPRDLGVQGGKASGPRAIMETCGERCPLAWP